MEHTDFELICCIVNAGFSQSVMEAAREAGAKGGTIVRARGSVNPKAAEFFNIQVQPDKEMIIILTPKTLRDDIMRAIYKGADLAGNAQGIVFSLPVSCTTHVKM